MFSKFFGNFLLNKGVITSQQLNEVFQEEKNSHVKLGLLAFNKGYMTLDEVTEVNEAQLTTDKRFGEIAIEKGYLTIDKVEELLIGQKSSYLLLSQILIDKNILKMEQISKLLFQYKNENGLTNNDLHELTSDNVEKIISSSLQIRNSTIEEYLVLLVKNIERHFHERSYVEEVTEAIELYPFIATQKIVGEYNLDTYFLLKENDFIKVASMFAEEDLVAVDELSISSVLEFLNLHNGIFIVNEVERGFDIDLRVQKLVETVSYSNEMSYFKCGFADIELVVGIQKDK